jgi:hypothetical protein
MSTVVVTDPIRHHSDQPGENKTWTDSFDTDTWKPAQQKQEERR